VNAVKIDRQFVMTMSTDHRRQAIVRATIALGHDLGFEVVAEGVEDIETWEQLAALGCDTAQGYHIARPMPPEAVSDWIASWESGLTFMRRERIGERIVSYERRGPADTAERAVLVVDDEPSILEVIRDILEHEGFRVLTAANGAEALKLVERSRPLVVLLDMSMPTLDGAGFVAELRERGLRVPVVVMTAGPSAERWAKELQADGYLRKPFDISSVIEVTRRFAVSNYAKDPRTEVRDLARG
jgi:CheY-like chemotaxis protein